MAVNQEKVLMKCRKSIFCLIKPIAVCILIIIICDMLDTPSMPGAVPMFGYILSGILLLVTMVVAGEGLGIPNQQDTTCSNGLHSVMQDALVCESITRFEALCKREQG